ncbi:hypothetical protein FSP39_015357 [Pinctada imbricata]|uniref:3'-5' exonuclease domain-containing protein n=1 Tax=Pinctada imbricata TaxID=66713 RepID=A0AA88XIZ2_PINIB|nr:hypothetical protein FSP39_015357 [Pinctada imbricata]
MQRADMPEIYHEKEVVTDTQRCRQVVHILQREIAVSLAGEGVALGREGPLTLVQVGTFYGAVYLFDILVNNELFDKGGLRLLLESDKVAKVTHSCCFLSAALFAQYAVRVRNVFDTQIAHLLISEHEGRQLPERLTLFDVTRCYSGEDNSYGWRSDVRDMWLRRLGDYWGQRPLTNEMVEFAADDAMAIIPEVYRRQYEYLEKNRLLPKFKARVEEEILVEVNQEVKDMRGRRIESTVKDIVRKMDEKYDLDSKLFEILDDDEMYALHLLHFPDAPNISEKVVNFKTKYILQELTKIEEDLHTEQVMISTRNSLGDDIKNYEKHPDERVRTKARHLRIQIYDMLLREIGRRYGGLSAPQIFTELEKQALRSLTPKSQTDPSIEPFVLAQHWIIVENDIDQALFNLRYGHPALQITKDFADRLRTYEKLELTEGT